MADPPELVVRLKRTPKAAVIYLEGRLQEAGALDLLQRAVASSGNNRVVLVMGKLEYINSSGFGALIGFQSDLKAEGGRLVVCDLVGPVESVFDSLAADSIMEIAVNEQEALERFGEG